MRARLFPVLLLLPALTSACAGPLAGGVYEHWGSRISASSLPPREQMAHTAEETEMQVVTAARDIVEHTGLKMNFAVVSYDVPTAMAYMGSDGSRLLLFNPKFIASVNDRVSHDWGVMAVMAHEIGHHLQGHIFKNDPNIYYRELEADEFSGFVLYRMGSTLEEAQLAVRNLAIDRDLPSHPKRDIRLAAIARGWFKAQSVAALEFQAAERRDAGLRVANPHQ